MSQMPACSPTFRRVAAVALSAGVLVFAMSCSSRADMDGEPEIGPVPILLNSADLRLPLDVFTLSAADVGRIRSGEVLLARECMKRFGFDYSPPLPKAARLLGNQRRYGVSDETNVNLYGYRLPPGTVLDAAPAGPDLEPAALSVLTGRGERSIHGMPIPEGGCAGEAHGKIREGGPTVTDETLVERLGGESFALSRQDSRVTHVVGQWSECMRRQGFDYTDPLDAPEDPKVGDGSSPESIAIAIADVSCKKATNLVGVWSTVETAYQRRLIEKNKDALDQVKESTDAQLKAAAALVGAS